MKYLKLILFFLILSNCQAQEKKLLVSKELVSDLLDFPISKRLIQDINGKKTWKEDYKYLDSIEIYKITYLSDGLKVNGLLIKPKSNEKMPCVIYNRGGNGDFGSLNIYTGIHLGKLANEGYVVIASQYRGNGGSEGKEEFGGKDVNDVLNLIDVLAEEKSADVTKIGMYGWSRGGMMTYSALTKTNKIKAAVVGGALADIEQILEDRPGMEKQVLVELVPDFEANKKEEIKKRSAIQWADKFSKNVPILILHGTSDWRVKPDQSLKMALAFTKYRVPYRLIMFEGGDHGLSEFSNEVDDQVTAWFDKYLKKEEPLPNMEYHGK